jgi:hypothetical protein
VTDFDILADGLRTWAAGDWIPAAAVEMLAAGDGTWLRRHDFPAACIEVFEEDGMARIDWDAARAFAASVTGCSGAEAAFLRLAVAIGSDEYRLASVDEDKRAAIVRAVASAARMEGLLLQEAGRG